VRRLASLAPGAVSAVALANKTARIVWAMMTRGEAYRPRRRPDRKSAAGARAAVPGRGCRARGKRC
jgi:hypothetical protein